MSVGARVLAIVSLAALADHACCRLALADRALPPTVACGATGLFPDPTDCHYYLDCTGDSSSGYTATISQCSDGPYYDACNGNCSNTPPPQCSFVCNVNNSISNSPQNPAIVFSCRANSDGSYTITVSKCSTDLEELGFCSSDTIECPVNNDQGPPDSGTSKCNETGTGYYVDEKNCSVYYYCSSADAKPDVGVCSNGGYFNVSIHNCVTFQCTSEGVFADQANCSSYYYCTRNASGLFSQHIACPSGSHFDSSAGGCMMGPCTTVCPGGTFSCPSRGYFADPHNCSWYYYCDDNLQATHVECPAGSHFDSVAGGCLMGSCSNSMV